MAAPYTSVSVSGYNANPPADDGSAVAANQIKWSTAKTKLGDPLNSFAGSVNAGILTAFAKVNGSAGPTSTAISYVVLNTDQGKLIVTTVAGVTITTPDATSVGSPFSFSILNISSGAITLAGSGSQNIDGVNTTSIASGAGAVLETDGSNWFTHGQQTGTVSKPQGRLTLTTATPVLASDATAQSTVFYTPYVGNLVPIYNGTVFVMTAFSELSLVMSGANFAASSIYDLFVVNDAGTLRLGIGPVWGTLTAGSGARGTGAGTTELQRLSGVWTNKVTMTLRYGASNTVSIAANKATYVGTIFIDGTNSQVSCHLSYGQSRKWGLWNAYNRVPIIMKCGDPNASWAVAAGIRAQNNDTTTSITTLTGLLEEEVLYRIVQRGTMTASQASGATTGYVRNGIGYNVTNAYSGKVGEQSQTWGNMSASLTFLATTDLVAEYLLTPTIGINKATACESLSNGLSQTLLGTEAGCVFTASWNG